MTKFVPPTTFPARYNKRNGVIATVHAETSHTDYPYLGLDEECKALKWSDNGSIDEPFNHPDDLIGAPLPDIEPIEGWIPVYRSYLAYTYSTRHRAAVAAKAHALGLVKISRHADGTFSIGQMEEV